MDKNPVTKPSNITLFIITLMFSGIASGISPAEVENVTLNLQHNTSEIYRSGFQTTPGEYSPSDYPYLSSTKPEALIPYGEAVELTNIYMPDGLVAYYPLDEASGNTASDITTALPDNDGTHVNFDGDELGAEGNISRAYNLSSSAFVDTDLDSYLSFSNFSVSLWIKPDTTSAGGKRLVNKDQGSSGWSLSIGDPGAGKIRFFIRDLDTVSLDTASAVSAGEWHHIVAVRDKSNQRRSIYVNAARRAILSSDTGSTDTNQNQVSIGAGSGGSNSFDGKVDDVRIYNSSLSQKEIERLYNYQKENQPGSELISATVSSGGFVLPNTEGGISSVESQRRSVESRSLLGKINPSFGFARSESSPLTEITYRSPYNLTGNSFSSASSSIVLRNTAGLGEEATISVSSIG